MVLASFTLIIATRKNIDKNVEDGKKAENSENNKKAKNGKNGKYLRKNFAQVLCI